MKDLHLTLSVPVNKLKNLKAKELMLNASGEPVLGTTDDVCSSRTNIFFLDPT